ncbi:MAG TPA: hypothetical protein VFZ39_16405, partial [Nocardioides sp.]
MVVVEGVGVDGDRDPGSGAVAGRRDVGVQGVLGELHQGVEHPGAVVAVILARLTGIVIWGLGLGFGERQEGGAQGGTVLDAATTADPHPAQAVVGDREAPVEVSGAFLAVQVLLRPLLLTLRVDHRQQVSAGAVQLGGVQPG